MHMMLAVQLAIIINIEYMKKFLFFLSLLLTLCNFAVGKISTESQRNLINTNIINKGISCDQLADLIGGLKSTSTLLLGNNNEEKHQYALINSNFKEEDKIYYVCKRNRNNYAHSNSYLELLSDQDLVKIYFITQLNYLHIFSLLPHKKAHHILLVD